MRDNEFFCFGCCQVFSPIHTGTLDLVEAQRLHQEECRRKRQKAIPAPTMARVIDTFEDEEA